MGMHRFGETVGSTDIFMSSGTTLITEDVKTSVCPGRHSFNML